MRVHMIGTMIQNGRGGIYSYIKHLLNELQKAPELELSISCLNGDESFFPQCSTTPAASWARGGLSDFIRTLLHERSPSDGILHCPSYRRTPWTPGGKMVSTVHDLAPLHMPEKYGFARYQFLKRFVPIGLRQANLLLTVTEHTKRDLQEMLHIPADTIRVTPNGIDHDVLHPVDRQKAIQRLQKWQPQLSENYVLYTSRLEHPGKGHIALLDAWKILGDRRNGDLPQLVFAGAEAERA